MNWRSIISEMSFGGLVDPPSIFPRIWGNSLEFLLELETSKANEEWYNS